MRALPVPLLTLALCSGAVLGTAVARDALDMLASHMLDHVVAMNVVAPVIVFLVLRRLPHGAMGIMGDCLVQATVVQIGLIWGWHLPGAFQKAHESDLLTIAMHASLFAAALAFWAAVFSAAGRAPWKCIVALLVTGKLFCLFGAVLIFAPRLLYALPHSDAMAGHATVDDQHLAGLIMVTACPLTYVGAAIAIAAFWLRDLGASVPRGGAA
jgi:putative membrane protein